MTRPTRRPQFARADWQRRQRRENLALALRFIAVALAIAGVLAAVDWLRGAC